MHLFNFQGDGVGFGANLGEIDLAAIVGEPGDLEWAVAFDEAAGVVVDRLAGTREEAGGGVVVAENQVRVGLGGLQCDADGHLADGAAGEA